MLTAGLITLDTVPLTGLLQATPVVIRVANPAVRIVTESPEHPGKDAKNPNAGSINLSMFGLVSTVCVKPGPLKYVKS